MLNIEQIDPKKCLNTFIGVPHRIYQDDPYYVPALNLQQRSLLHPLKNPFFRHSSMKLFVARRNGIPVGRIAAIVNNNHNRFHGDATGFFGFFDAVDNEEVAHALFNKAAEIARNAGLTSIRGPVNPDTNNSCGILTDGFARRPSVFMPYNKPYYEKLLTTWGAVQVKKLYAWDIQSPAIPERMLDLSRRTARRLEKMGYRIRPICMSRFDRDIKGLWEAYNNSLEQNGATVHLPKEYFNDQAAGLRLICRPEFIQLVEYNESIAGYIGAVPDLNEVLTRIHNGSLFPLGWWMLLTGIRKPRNARIVMFGVRQEHRTKGVPIWLYSSAINALRINGFFSAEASYVLDDNAPVNSLSEALGGVRTKQYAIFSKDT
jgi:GNAT superfamily N-acetyltransferase